MGNPVGVRRDFTALERRRMEAARLLKQSGQSLKRGPAAAGFATGLWTASRVRELIEDQCGVRYHEAHVWRILRQLGWSCQRSTGKALERDEKAIRYWKRCAGRGLKK